jgi:hypothetical protein
MDLDISQDDIVNAINAAGFDVVDDHEHDDLLTENHCQIPDDSHCRVLTRSPILDHYSYETTFTQPSSPPAKRIKSNFEGKRNRANELFQEIRKGINQLPMSQETRSTSNQALIELRILHESNIRALSNAKQSITKARQERITMKKELARLYSDDKVLPAGMRVLDSHFNTEEESSDFIPAGKEMILAIQRDEQQRHNCFHHKIQSSSSSSSSSSLSSLSSSSSASLHDTDAGHDLYMENVNHKLSLFDAVLKAKEAAVVAKLKTQLKQKRKDDSCE